MRFAESPRAGDQTGTNHTDLAVVVPLLLAISAELRDIRAQLEGRLKSHLTVDEVAALTGRVPYTIRRWVSDGRIHAERVNGTGPRGRLLIPRAELDKLISSGLGGESNPFLTAAETSHGSRRWSIAIPHLRLTRSPPSWTCSSSGPRTAIADS